MRIEEHVQVAPKTVESIGLQILSMSRHLFLNWMRRNRILTSIMYGFDSVMYKKKYNI